MGTNRSATLILVGLWLIFFSPALFFGKIFHFRDLYFFHYPLRYYWISRIFQEWPFLNGGLNGGHPILSNPNYGVFYPGNFLYLLLPFDTAWNISLAGHVLFASMGMYWFIRLLGAASVPALTAAVIFAYGGPFLSTMTYHNQLLAGSWLPWICGFFLESWRKGGSWPVITAVALALQFFAGEPTIEIITTLLIAPVWFIAFWKEKPPLQWKRLLVILGLFSLLIMIQALPAALWLPHSERGQGLPFRLSAAYWSLHPARLIELLAPHFHGDVSAMLVEDFWGGKYSDSGYPYILKLYAGSLALLILPLAWIQRWGRAGVLAVAAGILLSLGHYLPGYETLYNWFPPFRIVRYPEKFMMLALFGFATATALALKGLEKDVSRLRKIIPSFGFFLLVLILTGIFFPNKELSEYQKGLQTRSLLLSAGSAIVSVLLLYGVYQRAQIPSFLIPLVLFIDIGSYTWSLAASYSKEKLNIPPLVLQRIPDLFSSPLVHMGEKQTDFLFSGEKDIILYIHDSVYPLHGLRWNLTYALTGDIDRMGWWKSSRRQAIAFKLFPSPAALELLQQSGVQRVLSFLPLNVNGFKLEATVEPAPRQPLFVYRMKPPFRPMVSLEDNSAGTVQWFQETSYRFRISAKLSKATALILLQNCLPGWSAKVNGKETQVSQTQEGYLKISLPAGSHQMECSYHPPGLFAGTVLTLVGSILVVIVCKIRPWSSA